MGINRLHPRVESAIESTVNLLFDAPGAMTKSRGIESTYPVKCPLSCETMGSYKRRAAATAITSRKCSCVV